MLGTASRYTRIMNKTTAAYQDQHAYWNEDREPELLAVSVILIVATSLAIAIRFWAQCTIKKQRAHDNLVIVVAAVRQFSQHADLYR